MEEQDNFVSTLEETKLVTPLQESDEKLERDELRLESKSDSNKQMRKNPPMNQKMKLALKQMMKPAKTFKRKLKNYPILRNYSKNEIV